MSKKKKKNKSQKVQQQTENMQEAKVNRELDAQMQTLREAYEKEDAERKKRLAVKMPGEFIPDCVCFEGQFSGYPKELSKIESLNISDEEKQKRCQAVLEKIKQEAENQRHWFALYYSEGGDAYPSAEFAGEVVKIEKDRLLFNRIWMVYNLDDYDCTVREGTEDHVWIYDTKLFVAAGAAVGKCFKFNACAYAYRRTNGTVDFGLKCPENIEIIPRYELPDMKIIGIRDSINSAERLVCETCMYTEQCYEKGSPICLAPEGYKEERMRQIFFSNPQNIDVARKLVIDRFKLTDHGYLVACTEDLSKESLPGFDGQKGIVVTICPRPLPNRDNLNPGDILLEIDGNAINTENDVLAVTQTKPAGSTVIVKRLPCKAKDPDTITLTLFDKDQMADFYMSVLPLDVLADLADKAAHRKLANAG